MKRLVWLSDIHLNFLNTAGVASFLEDVALTEPAAVAISGDIGEAPDFTHYLLRLAERIQRPILFVLGNHDFYGSSIAAVREQARHLVRESPLVRYLPVFEIIQLSASTAIVGHDGWGDGRAGAGGQSPVELADFDHIQDLKGLTRPQRQAKLNLLGEEAAQHYRRVLPTALERFRHVFVLTHVPPFPESCWHQGRMADREWQPHFVCQAAGDALRELALRFPAARMTVLCGHTHSPGHVQVLPNLEVLTAAAEYGRPMIQRLFDNGE